MEIERYEKYFMVATLVVILGAAIALVVSVVGHHAALPEPAGRIAPADVRTTAPFDEPGLHDNGDGTYTLVYVAQAWAWTPREVTVPAGAEITILAATTDVIHGLFIPYTQANAMVIPGQITEVTVTLDEGTHSLICHEYCGLQHHVMGGIIHAE